MSTRALRKLQREQQQAKPLALVTTKGEGEEDDTESSEEEEEEESIPSMSKAKVKKKSRNKPSSFQVLEQGDEDEEDLLQPPSGMRSMQLEEQDTSGISTGQSTKPKRKKKRKAKDKGKNRDSLAGSRKIVTEEPEQHSKEVDEIDRALQELNYRKSLAASQQEQGQIQESQGSGNSWEKEVSKLLAIDSKNLNPTNEMRSLFGSIALERTIRNQGRADEEGRVDLETALNGRHSPISRGKEMGSLAKRRNIFMQGQENWPLATSGGLGMEVVKASGDDETASDLTIDFGKHYRIVHNSAYQETQRQFRQAVDSMSAEAMIHLLIYNPYHIATLLQVAEIAKHQGDHSVTGDLLERALFTFGRSVHSTFGVSVREGRARLSFEHSPNRELYLTIWRYIQNLEMRGTWRTAFEWGKLLLSFNILSDPYGITHVLDQYALRGRQHDALIELCSEAAFGNTWSHLPNMQISLALAYHRASQPKLARQKLALAMHRYPYILSHLSSTLEINPLPKSLWGSIPSTDAEKLYTELYVTRARDLWATPETTALLVEVAETLESYSRELKGAPSAPKLEISLEDARHILLLEIPALIALIPPSLRSQPTAQYDVLPPPSSADDAGLSARAPATANGPGSRGTMGFLVGLMRAASRGVLDWGTAAAMGTAGNENVNQDVNQEMNQNDHDPFNVTLADANLSPADRAAILAALHEDEDTLAGDDEQQREEGVPAAPIHPRNVSINNSQEDLIRNYRDEEPPLPSHGINLEEPSQFRIPAGSRLPSLPDEAAQGEDVNVSGPLPTNQHRPSPRTTSLSPPPRTAPGMGAGRLPLAPTVEDEPEPAPEVEVQADNAGTPAIGLQARTIHQPDHPRPAPSSANTPEPDPESNLDPQRIQRYLLSTGLSDLQAQKPGAMAEYVRRLRLLRHRDREWILGVVGQRVGAGKGGVSSGHGGVGAGNGDDLVARIRRALG